MPSALIADDEPMLRSQLRARLATLWPELRITDEAENGLQAVAAFDTGRREGGAPDLCFLDIHMPGLSGLAAARRIRELAGRAPHIVFVTAFDAHAIEAFEHGAIDYVLKPFDTGRLAETVERLKDRVAKPSDRTIVAASSAEQALLADLAERLSGLGPAKRSTLQWIKASVGSTVRLIPVEDVLYFNADDKYTRVVTVVSVALIRKPIKELIAELDGERFWQIHRATLVNTHAIAGVVRGIKDSADLKLKGRPETLTVSRAYLHLFRQM